MTSGRREWSPLSAETRATPPEVAYRALSRAAELVGASEYAAQRVRAGFRRYQPTPAHRDLVAAMADVAAGRITPAEAMSLLHWGETGEAFTRALRGRSLARHPSTRTPS